LRNKPANIMKIVAGLVFIGSFSCFVLYFFVFINPDQRATLFQDMKSKIPLLNNFVVKTYQTPLAITGDTSLRQLRTASLVSDYLVIAKDSENHIYMALYPFEATAGFDLKKKAIKSLYNKDSDGTVKSVEIDFPGAEIFSIDAGAMSSFQIIRNQITNASTETYLKPILIALEKQAQDAANRSNLLEKARIKADEWVKSLYKPLNIAVNTSFSEASKYATDTVEFKRMPIQITCTPDIAQLIQIDLPGQPFFGKLDLPEAENSSWTVIPDARLSGKELFETAAMGLTDKIITYRIFDPERPRDGNTIIRNYGNGGLDIFRSVGGNITIFDYWNRNKDMASTEAGTAIYAVMNMEAAPTRTYDSNIFIAGVRVVNRVYDLIEKDKFQSATALAPQLRTSGLDQYASVLEQLNRVLKGLAPQENTVNQDLSTLLKAYLSIQKKDKTIAGIQEELITLVQGINNNEHAIPLKSYLLAKMPNELLQEEQTAYLYDIISSGQIFKEIWLNTAASEKRQMAIAYSIAKEAGETSFWYAKDGEEYFKCVNPTDRVSLNSSFLWDYGWVQRVKSDTASRSENVFREALRRADSGFDEKMETAAAFMIADTGLFSLQRVDTVLLMNNGIWYYNMKVGATEYYPPVFYPITLAIEDPRLEFNNRQPMLKGFLSQVSGILLNSEDTHSKANEWVTNSLKAYLLNFFYLGSL